MVNDGELSAKCRVRGTWGAMAAPIIFEIRKKVTFSTRTTLDQFVECWETLYFTPFGGPDMYNNTLCKI